MAKQIQDGATLDIFGEKKRGRPVTGNALSAAERARRYRAKKREQPTLSEEANDNWVKSLCERDEIRLAEDLGRSIELKSDLTKDYWLAIGRKMGWI